MLTWQEEVVNLELAKPRIVHCYKEKLGRGIVSQLAPNFKDQ